MADTTVQHEETAIHLIHAMPGRVRLRVTGENAEPTLEAVSQLLQQQVGVEQVVTNAQTSSITVSFDAETIPLSVAMKLLEELGVDVSPAKQVSADHVIQTPVFSAAATEDDPFAAWKSAAFWKQQGRTFIPVIAGLLVARGLNLFGWRAILAYIFTSRTTRGLIDQLDTANPAILTVPALLNKNQSTKQPKPQPASVPPVTPAKVPVEASISYRLVHAIRGRVRFHIARLATDPQYANRLQKLVEAEPAVQSVRINSTAASIVISYNADLVPDAPMQERLAALIQQADTAKATTSPPPPPPSSGGTTPTSAFAENNGLPKPDDTEKPAYPHNSEIDVQQEEVVEKPVAEISQPEILPENAGDQAPLQLPQVEIETQLNANLEEKPCEDNADILLTASVLENLTLEKLSEIEADQVELDSQTKQLQTDLEPPAESTPALSGTSLFEKASLWYCLTQTLRSTVRFLKRGQPPWDAVGAGFQEALFIRLKAIAALHSSQTPALDQS